MLQPGTILGNYEILSHIAGGGMGVVYRARHRHLYTQHAIKVLLSTLALDERVQVRFRQEAKVQSELREHPHIVTVTDFVEESSQLGLVMDLIEGPSLDAVMDSERPGPWQLDDAMAILSPVLGALAFAHSRGVVHRDLKPANVVLDRSGGGLGRPQVTDFGLAKVLASGQEGLTRVGTVMGTLPYMAPEQFRGAKDVDASADVFALGMMLWRLLAGHLPVEPEDVSACSDLYAGRLPLMPPPDPLPGIPDAVIDSLRQALSLEPEARQPDARVLLRELTQAATAPPPPGYAMPGAGEDSPPSLSDPWAAGFATPEPVEPPSASPPSPPSPPVPSVPSAPGFATPTTVEEPPSTPMTAAVPAAPSAPVAAVAPGFNTPEAAWSPPGAAPATPFPPPPPPASPGGPKPTPPPKRSSRTAVWVGGLGCVGLLLLSAAGIGTVVLLQRSGSEGPPGTVGSGTDGTGGADPADRSAELTRSARGVLEAYKTRNTGDREQALADANEAQRILDTADSRGLAALLQIYDRRLTTSNTARCEESAPGLDELDEVTLAVVSADEVTDEGHMARALWAFRHCQCNSGSSRSSIPRTCGEASQRFEEAYGAVSTSTDRNWFRFEVIWQWQMHELILGNTHRRVGDERGGLEILRESRDLCALGEDYEDDAPVNDVELYKNCARAAIPLGDWEEMSRYNVRLAAFEPGENGRIRVGPLSALSRLASHRDEACNEIPCYADPGFENKDGSTWLNGYPKARRGHDVHHFCIGWAYAQLGCYAQARRDLERYLDTGHGTHRSEARALAGEIEDERDACQVPGI